MSRRIWLIIAASLMLIGCVIFAGVMTVLKWDFTKLSTVKYETNTYEFSEVFHSISMKTDTADITFVLSDDGKCKVECYENIKRKHSVTVAEETLEIKENDARSLLDHIGINFGSPKITIYLPKVEYASLSIEESTGNVKIPKDFQFGDVAVSLSTGDVDFRASTLNQTKIKTSTGNVHIENVSAGSMELSVSTGRITVTGVSCEGDLEVNVTTGKAYLTDVTCKNVISSGDTGDISLKDVTAVEKISIQRSTGDVLLDNCDSYELMIETDTGDVTGSLLSGKIFLARTDTGKVDVPDSTAGGKCEIYTDTGDIKITIK